MSTRLLSFSRHTRSALVLTLVAAAAQAQVTVTTRVRFVRSNLAGCTFQANHSGAAAPVTWVWEVVEADGGTIVAGPAGEGRYTPPEVYEERTFHVRARNAANHEEVGIAAIRVRPHPLLDEPKPAAFLERGLLPISARTFCDGSGGVARFARSSALAWVADPTRAARKDSVLVVDHGAHVIRLMDRDANVRTWAGRPGVRGHRDGQGAEALFDFPAFIATRPFREGTAGWRWETVVADMGSSVIRVIDSDGDVLTVAGRPRVHGFRDGDAAQALFNSPQGVAMDEAGTIFVADQGNCVIRVIGMDGRVSTLAGKPGLRGVDDGQGDAARFNLLRGMVRDPRTGDLYVADGDSVRRVSPGGRVTTILGVVALERAKEGFETPETHRPPEHEKLALARIPCLGAAISLTLRGDDLIICQRDPDAIRIYGLNTGNLRTLVNRPSPESLFRWDRPAPTPAQKLARVGAWPTPWQLVTDAQDGGWFTTGSGGVIQMGAGFLAAPGDPKADQPVDPNTAGRGLDDDRAFALDAADPASQALALEFYKRQLGAARTGSAAQSAAAAPPRARDGKDGKDETTATLAPGPGSEPPLRLTLPRAAISGHAGAQASRQDDLDFDMAKEFERLQSESSPQPFQPSAPDLRGPGGRTSASQNGAGSGSAPASRPGPPTLSFPPASPAQATSLAPEGRGAATDIDPEFLALLDPAEREAQLKALRAFQEIRSGSAAVPARPGPAPSLRDERKAAPGDRKGW